MNPVLGKLGIQESNLGGFNGEWLGGGSPQRVVSPVDGEPLATVANVDPAGFEQVLAGCHRAFAAWRLVPAPKRGEVVKALGDELRRHKESLAELVTLEMGKTLREGLGEVQEMIDICDFAVGLSRQLYGRTMPSERRQHRLQEQWLPLGVVGVITAFNFPVAVWSWNAAIALVCGDTVLWKPSSKTPLAAIACTRIAERVLRRVRLRSGHLQPGRRQGQRDRRPDQPGSAGRAGLLHRLGARRAPRGPDWCRSASAGTSWNWAATARSSSAGRPTWRSPCASVYFGAIGTSGQRCTSTRRVIIHESVYDAFVARLCGMYGRTRIGDPRENRNLMGPLVDTGRRGRPSWRPSRPSRPRAGASSWAASACPTPADATSRPCLAEVPADLPMTREETFAPVLYLIKYRTLEEAIRIQNDVPQGLSSAIISDDLLEAELFLSAAGSDCGIANVNAGTSGAEIGGAFGGEKETGGGRESGSDAWKAYMRRQTSAINFSGKVELAQGITLEI